jgi:D-beta-D-heptose 7-phosphate kinase / D-beta-D-heptose 1-phosphate adenosyltransferase
MTRLVVVGDALLDCDLIGTAERLCPDAPVPVVELHDEHVRPGGAALAAALLADDGAVVELVTAIGNDANGRTLRALLHNRGVRVIDLGLGGATPQKIRVRAGGQSVVRLDRCQPVGAVGQLGDEGLEAVQQADGVLVADYGRGISADARIREAMVAAARRVPVVWDPHPRGDQPVAGCALVTPNDSEARLLTKSAESTRLPDVASRANALVEAWAAHAVAITMGPRGALVARPSGWHLAVPAPLVVGGDSCGAGDCFAGAAAHALAGGAILEEAVQRAVHSASAFVAAGGAATVETGPRSTVTGVEAVRARGGCVVATGGCFDLLHAGHVSMLEAARRLGDYLVVLLNSDRSVRKLKGRDRPVQPVADRRRILSALGCVDEVIVFDEDTPLRALAELRPDVFVKGADYTVESLPESMLVSKWGGRAVVVPYLAGRSTTRMIADASGRGRR